jgi:hypothetical protein
MEDDMTFRLVCLVILLSCVTSGCAQKKYRSPTERVVDTETKVIKSTTSGKSVEIEYLGGEEIIISTSSQVENYVTKRKKTESEKCWTIKRGTGNPIIDIISIPFAILEALVESPKPGCRTNSYWGNWSNSSTPEISKTPYSGQIYLESGNPNIIHAPSSVVTDSSGIVRAKLTFKAPFLPETESTSISNKIVKAVLIKAHNNNASTSKEVMAFDVSPYMEELVDKYFDKVSLSIADRNSRYPLSDVRVTIKMKNTGYKMSRYVNSLKLPNLHKNHLKEYVRLKYGDILLNHQYTVFTDSNGVLSLLVPKKTINEAKMEFRHKNYYYREVSAQIAKNMIVDKGAPDFILLDDIGDKTRTESARRGY